MQHYLIGNHYEIYSNHKSLKYLFSQLDLNLSHYIWIELIKYYDFNAHYTLGKANFIADALSKKSCHNLLLTQAYHPALEQEF